MKSKLSLVTLYINLILILTILFNCYKVVDINYFVITIVFIITLALFLLYTKILKKVSIKLYFTLLTLIIFGLLYHFKGELFERFFIINLQDNLVEVANRLNASKDIDFNLILPFIIITVFAITLIFLFLWEEGLNNGILLFTVVIFIALWYTGMWKSVLKFLPHFIIIFLVTYGISSYVNNLKKLKQSNVNRRFREYKGYIYIAIASIVIFAFTLILPKNIKGHYLDNFFSTFNGPRTMNSLVGGYSISSSGYNDSSNMLGGKISINNKLVMEVLSDKGYYLKGSVKDKYTGYSWENSFPTVENSGPGYSNTKKFGASYASEIQTVRKMITIEHKLDFTNSIFTPMLTESIYNLEDKKINYDEFTGTYSANNLKTSKYVVNFYDENSFWGIENEYQKNLDTDFKKGNVSTLIKEKKIAVLGDYLDVPDTVTKRTIDLTKEITKDCNNDIEKIDAITSYLKENYPYSLNVSNVPQDEDFVDYFLFQEKKGYCVYFASALSIMLRIEGIPTRYVEGFKMPQKQTGETFKVTNECAHAWVEALTFVPNISDFVKYIDNNQTIGIDGSEGIWEVCDASPSLSDLSNITSEENSSSEQIERNSSSSMQREDRSSESSEQSSSNTIENNKVPLKNILVFFIIISPFVTIPILNSRNKNKILNSKSGIPLYKYVLKRLKTVKIIKNAWETDLEFVEKIPNIKLRKYVEELVIYNNSEIYGNKLEIYTKKKQLYYTLEEFLKTKENIVLYYIKKFLSFYF